MASIYDIKPAFQNLLRPLVSMLARLGVTANQVTIGALLLSLAEGGAIFLWPESRWPLLCLPLVLSIRMGLNAIDGMLAREHGMQSALGGFLNELSDVAADAALYLPFALVAGISPTLVVISVILSLLTEMAGVVSVQVGSSRRYDGPMGKSDRAFVFGFLGLLLGIGLNPAWWANIALVIVSLLTTLTIYNRVTLGLQELAAGNETQPN